MVKYILLILLANVALAAPNELNTSSWKCNSPTWLGEPQMNSEGLFEAVIVGNCFIDVQGEGSISILYENFYRNLPNEYQIHGTPTPTTYTAKDGSKLNGYRLIATSQFMQDGKQISMDEILNLVFKDTRLIFDAQSTNIQGEDLFKYYALNEDVKQDPSSPQHYKVSYTQTVKLEKPGYAPEFIFIPRAKKDIMASFVTDLKTMTSSLAKLILKN